MSFPSLWRLWLIFSDNYLMPVSRDYSFPNAAEMDIDQTYTMDSIVEVGAQTDNVPL